MIGTYWDSIVTVKIIEKLKLDCTKFMEELKIILKNPYPLYNYNIIGTCETNTQIYLIYNINECCSLFNLIHQKKLEIPIENLKKYINDIIKYINFLHTNNMLVNYKDLNLTNLYISKDGKYLFADIFGYSTTYYMNKNIKSLSSNIKQCGSITYMAPELFLGKDLNYSADIYSFGIIVYEIFSNKIAYEGKKEKEIIIDVVKGSRPDLNNLRKDTPTEYIELMMKCWEKDPLKRPNSNDILYFLQEL